MNTADKCVAYTENAKLLLASLVDTHKDVIENKKTDATTVSKKQQAWEVIAKEYNCQANIIGVQRSWLQLKKLWSNLKQRKPNATTELKYQRLLTGGGPEPHVNVDPVMEAVDVAALHADVYLTCPWDSTAAFETNAGETDFGNASNKNDDHSYTRDIASPGCSGMSDIASATISTPKNKKYLELSTPSSTKAKRKTVDIVQTEASLRLKKIEVGVHQQEELHRMRMSIESEQLKSAIAIRKKAEAEYNEVNIVVFDEVFLNNRGNYRRRIPRVQNYIQTVIDQYIESDFRENYRLSRETFEYLLHLIQQNLGRLGAETVLPKKQLLIALYYLGTPDSYRSIADRFNTGRGTALRAVKRVVRAICQLRNIFIRWPSEIEAQQTAGRIHERKGFPGVIGAVDATHIRIAAPRNNPQSYINRKGFHSIQLQGVCNDRLESIHCYVGLPGSVHDARVFRYSGLQQRCNEIYFPGNTHLLGDSAYTLQNNVIMPYTRNGHLTIEEEYFNTKLSSVRTMIERAFGILKGRWRRLLDKVSMQRTYLIPYYILCACVLHNICLKRGDELEHPVVVPKIVDGNMGPIQVENNLQEQGIVKRLKLTRIVNANVFLNLS